MASRADRDPATAESSYIVNRDVSPDAIASNLRSLLPSRQHAVARRRFALLDTFDGRVRRAGGHLTKRGPNSASVLAWQPRGRRSPLELELKQPASFAWDLPDGALRQSLAPVIGVRRLLAQADAEQHGSVLDVLDDRGKTVARLRIAAGQARLPVAGAAWRPLPTVVTVTGLRGYEEAYERIVPLVESRPGMVSCPEGLHGLVLRHAGVPDTPDFSSLTLDLAPSIRADEGARLVHLALLGLLVANEPGLRANLDTEFLHDFRVTVRRIRSLLGQIRHVFRADAVERFAAEFSWLGRLTGPSRDLDVLVLALRAGRFDVSPADHDALMEFLTRRQAHEHSALVAALDSERYRRLLAAWNAFLTRPEPVRSQGRHAGRPLADLVSRRAWRLSRRLVCRAEAIDTQTPAVELHEMRIDAKKLRYLIDVTAGFYDPTDLDEILESLKQLQRVLGDVNDAGVQARRLIDLGHTMAAAGGPAGALLALGRLAEQSRQRGERLRDEAADMLDHFRRKAMRRACRRTFKHATLTEQT